MAELPIMFKMQFGEDSVRVFELQARLKILEFRVAGYVAENQARAVRQEYPAYQGDVFECAASDADLISRELEAIAIKAGGERDAGGRQAEGSETGGAVRSDP
jgi:hypothetical protein